VSAAATALAAIAFLFRLPTVIYVFISATKIFDPAVVAQPKSKPFAKFSFYSPGYTCFEDSCYACDKLPKTEFPKNHDGFQIE